MSCVKIFSDTKKTCSNRSGLSIAPTPDRFGHPTREDIDHIAKSPPKPPHKKIPSPNSFFGNGSVEQ
eukprot:UN10376